MPTPHVLRRAPQLPGYGWRPLDNAIEPRRHIAIQIMRPGWLIPITCFAQDMPTARIGEPGYFWRAVLVPADIAEAFEDYRAGLKARGIAA